MILTMTRIKSSQHCFYIPNLKTLVILLDKSPPFTNKHHEKNAFKWKNPTLTILFPRRGINYTPGHSKFVLSGLPVNTFVLLTSQMPGIFKWGIKSHRGKEFSCYSMSHHQYELAMQTCSALVETEKMCTQALDNTRPFLHLVL